jgi:hypothetical protein
MFAYASQVDLSEEDVEDGWAVYSFQLAFE